MSGQPINQGQQLDSAPDKIELLGGGICDCCAGGFCYACWCLPCAWANAAEDAREGTFLVECLFTCFLPCYFPICTTSKVETVNAKLGGQSAFASRCCCQLCCSPCAVAQFSRAVKNARSKGLLAVGAPDTDNGMEK